MECEVNVLKRKVQEYQEHSKNLREFSRAQRDKLKQVIVACASQLQEKEAAMEQMRLEHDATLAYIARQLAFLQANMLKEQQKLEAVVGEKTHALETLALENERLRKQNKKLVSKTNNLSDTTSSFESSPKSSFSSKSSEPRLPPPEDSASSSTGDAGNDTADRTVLDGEPNIEEMKPPPKKPICGPKPPVPSRAGINRLLMQSASLAATPAVTATGTTAAATSAAAGAPPPPRRSTSLGVNSNLERADSGRESDLTTSDVEHTTVGIIGKRQTNSHDEGFCSSHEDSSGSGRGGCSRTSINHRTVQKPKDIKLRSKAKLAAANAAGSASATTASSATAASTTSNSLQTLLEHQVVDDTNGSGGVTTVTYWTGSFL